jgi:hypothetical protein
VITRNRTWQEIFYLAGENGWPLADPPDACTDDQRKLVLLHREVQFARQLAQRKGYRQPDQETFFTYQTFREWLDWLGKAQDLNSPGLNGGGAQHGWVVRK